MSTNRIAYALRHWVWRLVAALSGGLSVTGRWQVPGGRAARAMQSSNACTLLRPWPRLPPKARPVFAAAADYWFDVPVRRFIASTVAGVLPVRRSGRGTYAELLAAARPALMAGRAVIIYPEGTRSTNGRIGEFRSGAVRLARDCGVPIVPDAVLGTADVLPKGASFISPAPMQIRIGEPVEPNSVSTEDLRDQIMELRGDYLPQTSEHYALAA